MPWGQFPFGDFLVAPNYVFSDTFQAGYQGPGTPPPSGPVPQPSLLSPKV